MELSQLVVTNVKSSFHNDAPPFDLGTFMRVEPPGSKPSPDPHVPPFVYGPYPRYPWFYVDAESRIRSCQEEYFGIYALSTMVRSLITATSFTVAGDQISEHRFSPAILCYYTGAYHTLTAYLARQGRVFVDPAAGPPVLTVHGEGSCSYGFSDLAVSKASINVTCAVLTSSNQWIFEGRRRSHSARWNELFQISSFEKTAPKPILAVVDYLTTYGGDLTCPPEQKLRYGIERIASVRHVAAYQGYGADDFALDLAMNGQGGGGTQIRREQIAAFARDWLTDMLVEVAALCGEVRSIAGETQLNAFRLSSITPFEYGRLAEPARRAYDDIIGILYELPTS